MGEKAPNGKPGCRTPQDNLVAAFDPDQTSFYVCGPAAMVDDTRRALVARGARQDVLVPAGVTYPEFLVLMTIREEEAPTQDHVALCLDTSKSLVSQRVSALVAKGLVRQQVRPDNRRQVSLELTDEGRHLIEALYQGLAGPANRLFDTLGPGREGFRQTLAALVSRLT